MTDGTYKTWDLGGGIFVGCGDCAGVLPTLPPDLFDAIVTDPPYGLEFMGKGWDDLGRDNAQQAWHALWLREAFRVLKPGGHVVAFGGSRTFHRLFCAAEDAGFEIRDTLMWLYGSGFPKSYNLAGKLDGWDGWGTALKPAHEPILLARKPLIGTVVKNVQTHGVGALNIDASRIGFASAADKAAAKPGGATTAKPGALAGGVQHDGDRTAFVAVQGAGRWPANVLLDPEAAALLDAQTGTLTSGKGTVVRATASNNGGQSGPTYGAESRKEGTPMISYADSGGASRFFYCAKAAKSEKEAGCADLAKLHGRKRGNHHPTVKPVALMEYLIRLVLPDGGLLLDPFAGSGTTLVAAARLGQRAVGVEREEEYVEVLRARVEKALAERGSDDD
jgi:hypothetical protein